MGAIFDVVRTKNDAMIFNELRGKTSSGPGAFAGIKGGREGMTAQQRKAFKAREAAKKTGTSFGEGLAGTANTPLTSRYS